MAKSSSGLFRAVPSGVKPSSTGGSAKTYQPVGSGSRPTRSSHELKSSAPQDAYTLGRSTKGALK